MDPPSVRVGKRVFDPPGARDGRRPSRRPGGPAPKRREHRRAHSAGPGSRIAAFLARHGPPGSAIHDRALDPEPVRRRVHAGEPEHVRHRLRRKTAAIRCLAFGRLSMNRPGRYRPERRLPGGNRTHQERAPFHGAPRNTGQVTINHDSAPRHTWNQTGATRPAWPDRGSGRRFPPRSHRESVPTGTRRSSSRRGRGTGARARTSSGPWCAQVPRGMTPDPRSMRPPPRRAPTPPSRVPSFPVLRFRSLRPHAAVPPRADPSAGPRIPTAGTPASPRPEASAEPAANPSTDPGAF